MLIKIANFFSVYGLSSWLEEESWYNDFWRDEYAGIVLVFWNPYNNVL